ncbi:hypothetical protein PUN28_009512 [Cardiocondyla obscurior]|uniref:Uncharacterized protein n=1 Tax=Cardiocondyla obscurior TaxID=286306 RepID=A0AAW2FXK3_9HYME
MLVLELLMHDIIETCHCRKQIYDDFCKMQFCSRDTLSPPSSAFSKRGRGTCL